MDISNFPKHVSAGIQQSTAALKSTILNGYNSYNKSNQQPANEKNEKNDSDSSTFSRDNMNYG